MWHEDTSMGGGCSISPQGIISLRLHDRVRVDVALDRAVRVLNFRSSIVMALSASGSSAALLHPNGRVYQYGSRVEILAHDNAGNNKWVPLFFAYKEKLFGFKGETSRQKFLRTKRKDPLLK